MEQMVSFFPVFADMQKYIWVLYIDFKSSNFAKLSLIIITYL